MHQVVSHREHRISILSVRIGRGFHMQDHMVFGLVWGVGRDW